MNIGNEPTEQLALTLWKYLKMNTLPKRADILVVLGSHDIRVAHRAADMFLQGYASYVVFSGGFGRLTGDFPKPEAEVFANEARLRGVPEEKIIIENQSTNTGQNIEFSMKILSEKGMYPRSVILVTKPYMERRAYATFKKQFSDIEVTAASPVIDISQAAYHGFSQDDVINIMVGDLQRIKLYPEKGFQIYQEIPEDVWLAYEELVRRGYNKQLIT